MSKFMEDLRQMIVYSKEFRIAAPRWWDLTDFITIENMIEMIKSPKSEKPVNPAEDKKLLGLIAETGTTLWRLRRRVTAGGDPPQEMKRISRDIEAMEDALSQANIEIIDPAGQKYADGMALKVIARQKTPGIASETVIETIKPTIFMKNVLIQRGEVIVGVPESDVVSGNQQSV
jgi:hypothetical protein